MLDSFGGLLCEVDLTDEGLKRGLGCLSTENSVYAQPISSMRRNWMEQGLHASNCLKICYARQGDGEREVWQGP